jgi:hypothetical protein
MNHLNILGCAIASIPIALGCSRLDKGGEKWLLAGLIQWFVCYQFTIAAKTTSYLWYVQISLLIGVIAATAGAMGNKRMKGEKTNRQPFSATLCLLIVPAAITCYLLNGGLYIDWSPFDTVYYFNHIYTADQLSCAVARGALTNYNLSCTWVYALAQYLLGLRESTSVADARIFVAASSGLLTLSTGLLIHRCISGIWFALLGQALALGLLGWHEFSFIQSNGTNGYMIGLSCCYLSIATVTTKDTWFSRRIVSNALKACLLLIAVWASYMAHPQTAYTWLALTAGIAMTLLIRMWGIRQFIMGFLAASLIGIIAANLFDPNWFSPTTRDWTGLVNTGEVSLIRIPGQDFMSYMPWLRPFSDPAYGFWITLVLASTAAIVSLGLIQTSAGEKKCTTIANGFLFAPLVILIIWTVPPWCELYIRSVPGEFNTISRSIWGASTWVALPIAISTLLARIDKKELKRLFLASTGLLIIPIFVPLQWNGTKNILRAKTVHLFESSDRYGGLDVEMELLPVLRRYCQELDPKHEAPVMLADGYITDFMWSRSCVTATPLNRMQLFEKRYLTNASPILPQPKGRSREEHVLSELARTNASVVVLRKKYPRYTSGVAQRSGLWDADLAEQMEKTNIRLITGETLRTAGFKQLDQTKSFVIYTKQRAKR